MNLDLDDLIPGSVFFRWREALWLQTWGVCVFPSPIQRDNIIKVAQTMDFIRNRFGKPIVITSWLRPSKYNEWSKVNGIAYGVGGAKGSAHTEGKAVDFKVLTVSNEEVRSYLEKQLEHLNIRMEKDDGKDRIHIDTRTVRPGENRYFNP